MADYKKEDWLVNLPLYAIDWIANYHISQRFVKAKNHPQYSKRLLWEHLHPAISRCVLFQCMESHLTHETAPYMWIQLFTLLNHNHRPCLWFSLYNKKAEASPIKQAVKKAKIVFGSRINKGSDFAIRQPLWRRTFMPSIKSGTPVKLLVQKRPNCAECRYQFSGIVQKFTKKPPLSKK